MSTSRKRSKASKGKKSNSASSRSLAGDGGGGSTQADMAGLQEPGGDASGAGPGDDPWVFEKKKAAGFAKAKAPAGDRLVYFDPQIILPPTDKRSGEAESIRGRRCHTPLPIITCIPVGQSAALHLFVSTLHVVSLSLLLDVVRSGNHHHHHHREALSSQWVNEKVNRRAWKGGGGGTL